MLHGIDRQLVNGHAGRDREIGCQWTFEAFNRFQVTENLTITPNIQLVRNPALNTTTDTLWVFGLRTRLTF